MRGTPGDYADHCPQEDAEGLIVEHQHNTDPGEQAGIVPAATTRILGYKHLQDCMGMESFCFVILTVTLVSGTFLDREIRSETVSDIPYLSISLADPERWTG